MPGPSRTGRHQRLVLRGIASPSSFSRGGKQVIIVGNIVKTQWNMAVRRLCLDRGEETKGSGCATLFLPRQPGESQTPQGLTETPKTYLRQTTQGVPRIQIGIQCRYRSASHRCRDVAGDDRRPGRRMRSPHFPSLSNSAWYQHAKSNIPPYRSSLLIIPRQISKAPRPYSLL